MVRFSDDENKKNFIQGIIWYSYFLFFFKIMIAGAFQAIVSFFVKKKLEDLDQKNKS